MNSKPVGSPGSGVALAEGTPQSVGSPGVLPNAESKVLPVNPGTLRVCQGIIPPGIPACEKPPSELGALVAPAPRRCGISDLASHMRGTVMPSPSETADTSPTASEISEVCEISTREETESVTDVRPP